MMQGYGTKELALTLRTNRGIKLRVLDLSDNLLKDRGALELSNSIRVNHSLQAVNLSEN